MSFDDFERDLLGSARADVPPADGAARLLAKLAVGGAGLVTAAALAREVGAAGAGAGAGGAVPGAAAATIGAATGTSRAIGALTTLGKSLWTSKLALGFVLGVASSSAVFGAIEWRASHAQTARAGEARGASRGESTRATVPSAGHDVTLDTARDDTRIAPANAGDTTNAAPVASVNVAPRAAANAAERASAQAPPRSRPRDVIDPADRHRADVIGSAERHRADLAPSRAEAPGADVNLGAQVAILTTAQSLLQAHNPLGAGAALARYRREFPLGAFDAEALALEIEVADATADAAEVERLGARFLATYPASPHVPRVRAALDRRRAR